MVSLPALQTLCGVTIINYVLGAYASFGNIMPYIVSYMRKHGSPDMTYDDFFLANAAFSFGRGTAMLLAGAVADQMGAIYATALGSVLYTSGELMAYFTLDGPFWVFCLFYGLVKAAGLSIALVSGLRLVAGWYTESKSTAFGVCLTGFGGGIMIFNQVQTLLVNPSNVPIDIESGYFLDDAVLDRVPLLLVQLAIIYAVSQLIGLALLMTPEVSPTGEVREDKAQFNIKSSRDALRHKEFYILWTARFCMFLIYFVIVSFYKVFGATFISDDSFLSRVESLAALFSLIVRILVGPILDRVTYKSFMLVTSLLTFLNVATFCYSELAGQVGFLVWVCGYFLLQGFTVAVPSACVDLYGQRLGSTVFGYLESSEMLVGLIIMSLHKPLILLLDWCGYFAVWGSCALLVFITTLFYPNM